MSLDALSALGDTLGAPEPPKKLPELKPGQIVDVTVLFILSEFLLDYLIIFIKALVESIFVLLLFY